ncbi:DUF4855 domain-containing protein [Ferdinandcohnia quinoae]|uniref:DUF4855 domain-containing protein n=1 Tax=Fredinandcohnia quinoae TaxID=2918902 RepID=A0AAW5E4T4_9BACI|nr:DUF4855 domain-containing protein [Fredinandcohnia sp. SECRCQ15]MCH1626255.1 DUF4855 domain-containing protein [Fredinandcohnia sp. SECRCQ15]
MSTNEYMSAEEIGVQNHICLLPYGEDNETGIKNWTAEDLKPYQSYLMNGEAVDTMFNGFIFNQISGRKDHFLYPMYSDFGLLAEKRDWRISLKRLFFKGFNFDAIARNTKKGKKTDIWVTMPYPNLTQTKFGKVNGEILNFKEENSRLKAIKWWIKKFLNKWDNAQHLHEKLDFKGFVWPRASIDGNDEIFVKKVNAYVHENDLLSLWLQQYGSTGCVEWKEFGFDASCTNPNFYGKTGPDFKWIANATVFSRHYHTGFQILLGKGVLFKENHLFDYLNYGVYNEYMNKSLLVYQFPNQTLRHIYENHLNEYNSLYSFIQKTYTPVYPTAAFPS